MLQSSIIILTNLYGYINWGDVEKFSTSKNTESATMHLFITERQHSGEQLILTKCCLPRRSSRRRWAGCSAHCAPAWRKLIFDFLTEAIGFVNKEYWICWPGLLDFLTGDIRFVFKNHWLDKLIFRYLLADTIAFVTITCFPRLQYISKRKCRQSRMPATLNPLVCVWFKSTNARSNVAKRYQIVHTQLFRPWFGDWKKLPP